MASQEMTGSPNIVIVPDPGTFRSCRGRRESAGSCATSISPAACRSISRRGTCCAGRSAVWRARAWGSTWSARDRMVSPARRRDRCADEHIGAPGVRGRPIKTAPRRARLCAPLRIRPGPMQDALSGLVAAFEKIGLPLRSIENEWGPGQVECTFAARPCAEAADQALCFAPRRVRSAAEWAISPLSCAALRSRATIPMAGICTSRWSSVNPDATCSCRIRRANTCRPSAWRSSADCWSTRRRAAHLPRRR